ncbi:MAG: low specificity L-threonine aldolase [Oligoflexia bacterium]|nr:low specificity L-threonine aldolase [Oligoflexia bacterium]
MTKILRKFRSFASDNNSGVHPEVMSAMEAANGDHVVAYGDDPVTDQAEQKFQSVFGADTEVYFVFNGTAANVLSLMSCCPSYGAIVASSTAHLAHDECGAPEKHLGSKVIQVPHRDGKIAVDDLEAVMVGFGDAHRVQPKVLSLTQATEMGSVYQPGEIQSLVKVAKKYGLLVHMDGARISNAAVSLGLNLRQATKDLGIDILSLGGTKNGLMGAEAVVFFNSQLSRNFQFLRKQSMQLASKMRFLSAQFLAFFENDLWKRNATHANQMAKKLGQMIVDIPGAQLARPVEVNSCFVRMSSSAIEKLQKEFFFYVWEPQYNEIRLMTSFDTTDSDLVKLTEAIRKSL